MSFPTPQGRQQEVVYLDPTGHTVVLGSAGSGKTTMAILRAKFLAELIRSGNERVLLVTYNKALVTYLKAISRTLRLSARLDIHNYHHFARGYLGSKGRMGSNMIADSDVRSHLIAQAVQSVRRTCPNEPIWQYPPDFFAEECTWIAGCSIDTAEAYYNLRVDPENPHITPTASQCIFAVYQHYLLTRQGLGYRYDWDDIAHVVAQTLAQDQEARRYRHIVIDEGQDFTPAMIRSLAHAIPSNGSLTFFGDMAQQIYGNRISWRMAGLRITEPWLFQENYRNTRQIANLCLAMTRTPAFRGVVDLVTPRNSRADGPLPTVVRCNSPKTEINLVVERAQNLSRQQSVAILLRRRNDEDTFMQALRGHQIQRLHREMPGWNTTGISIGTFHSAKGLEFDTVIVPYSSMDRFPDQERLHAFARLEDGLAQEARLLYVGMSRTRTRLIMTYTGEQTNLLPTDNALYQRAER
jgi:superfamily I DNA/RNA helicase